MKNLVLFSSVVCFGIVLLTGCARDISSGTYDARTLDGAALNSYPCKVISARKVQIEEGEYLEDKKTGALVGGIAGGLAGNMIGGGKGRVLATGLGALAGAAGGAYAEKALKSQPGYEYTVQLEDGRMKTVVQGVDVVLFPGQNAMLIEGRSGRSRLVAR